MAARVYGGFPNSVCSSGWYRSHRENHYFCPRKVEKVEKFTCQEISARKNRKIRKNRKVEKSKSSNNSKKSKNSKSRKLFGFLTFCENFPWKSDKPRGVLEALEHRQYPRTGLFMVVWLLFPGRMVGYFPGEQETCNQCIRIRFCVANVISGFLYFFCVDFVVFESWILKTHRIC